MEDMVFSLGVDEIGMSFILVGQQEVAKRYIAAVLGKIDPSEVRGRLLAAYDTLMARKLVTWSEEEQRVVLDDKLGPLIETIASPDVSVVATIINGNSRETIAFHFGSRANVEVRDGGLAGQGLRPLDGPDAARASMEAFMIYPESLDGKRYTVAMTPAQIDDARKLSIEDPDSVEGFLADIGLDTESSQALASDLIRIESRGTVIRLDYSGDVARLDRGFLTLKSSERCWIFKLQGNGDNSLVDGTVATSEELRNELTELMS